MDRNPQQLAQKPDMKPPTEKLVVDELISKQQASYRHVGNYVIGAPKEMTTTLDYTGLRGSAYGIYHALINKLPKMKFTVKKVDEWLEVTPTYADYYNITVTQKQKLEGAIKQGLQSAAQAVADYELLAHDARRYREMLDYFKTAKHTGDEHVLRNVFVDRVDAFTGENYSMITMVRRWPTIITDFIRMKSGWDNIDTIRKELDVTQAEATVLKTKNELYREWVRLFLPNLKERYSRIDTLLRSRRQSIDAYRTWLKPYIARFKMIREKQEDNAGEWLTEPNITPGWGQSQALSAVRLWCWRAVTVPERRKAEAYAEVSKGSAKWVIHPYDDVVKEWQKRIEEHYNVEITNEDVKTILENATDPNYSQYFPMMDPSALYYVFFDMHILLSLVKAPPPEGFETDNLMFIPFDTYIISQNILLVFLIELKAREKAFDKYIEEIIGSRRSEENVLENIEKEFEPEVPGRRKRISAKLKPYRRIGRAIKTGFEFIFYRFVRRGPYESIYYERMTKMYFREMGPIYSDVVKLLEGWMRIK
ncbi:MAG: hypothetical protein KKA90_02835 [Nanoarchaeota archaeon]|nr:hypothetical protein [Nanoarchaeota archaeon]